MAGNIDINHNVTYHSAAIDDARVEENAGQKYHRNFWSSAKGHMRGWFAGGTLGAILGSGLGLAALSFATAGVPLLPIFAAFAVTGTIFGVEAYSAIAAAGASRAAGLAEKHARRLDPNNKNDPLKIAEDKLMYDGRGHHYEFPQDRDDGKIFSWKSGLLGTTIGAASGGILGFVGHDLVATSVMSAIGTSLGIASAPLALAAAGAIVLGIAGMSFGIERGFFKSLFNQIDFNVKGKIHDGTCIDIGKEQAIEQGLTVEDLNQQRLNRQADIQHLDKEYNRKIFWGGIKGAFNGFAGGLVIGAAIGLAVGGVVLGGLALFATPVSAALLLPAFASAGAMFGMKIFADAGREAGAESTARAIDDEFERNLALQERGMSPEPAKKPEGQWFNLGTGLIMGTIGAVAGLTLAPILAATPALAGLAPAAITGLSSLTGGLFGASFGLGDKIIRGITDKTDEVYYTTYNNHSGKHDPEFNKELPQPSNYHKIEITPQEAAKLEAKPDKNFGEFMINRQQSANIATQTGR